MEFISILNLIIAVQALFLSVHFFFKNKGERLLNRILSFLCLAFAIIAFNTYQNLKGILIGNSIIQDISNNMMWFIAPSLYLYTIYKDKSPDRKIIALNLLPFVIPASIDLLFNWYWFSQNVAIIGFIQMCAYLFLSIRYVVSNYTKSNEFYHWILPSVIVFTVLVLVNIGFILLRINGIELLSNPAQQSFTSLLVIPIFFLAYKEMNSTNDFGISPKKYQTTHLSEEHVKGYLEKIENAMKEEQLFLIKQLTLRKFSQHINIQPKYISQAINQQKGLGFSEYVLQFRLEKVKAELVDSKNKHLTIFGIAQDCGFNSNSRFSHLFKKHTGLTAKQFQQKYSK